MSEFLPGGDPHLNSGIPNRAFYLAARAIGGKSWDRTGRIWFAAMLDEALQAEWTFGEFADCTVLHAKKLFGDGPESAGLFPAQHRIHLGAGRGIGADAPAIDAGGYRTKP